MRPRCFFIATNWNRAAIPSYFKALASELAARGHRVVLLVGDRKHSVENHEGNYSVWTWPSERPTRFRDAVFLYRLIRRFHPDCLISNFSASNIMLLVGWLMNVPCRIDWYHTVTQQIDWDAKISPLRIKLLRLRKRLVYKAATKIVAVSVAARKNVSTFFGVPEDKCAVQYYLLADPMKDVDLSSSGRRETSVVCVGRLDQCKGQDVLIRAIAASKDVGPDYRVEFLGDGPCKASLLRLAHELGVQDNCVFRGTVGHNEVIKLMAAATVTVVPSRNEAFGLVNIESLAVGTPVIASAVDGIVEIVRDGVDGFLVPPDDPGTLSERLLAILSDPKLRQRMSVSGRERFLATFELGIMSERAEWLESVVTSSRQISDY